MPAPVRLAYLVSHPIQYQAPLLRRIAQEPDIELTVLFGSDFSARNYEDKGFGTSVQWDVPLLEGYQSRVLPAVRDNGTVTALTPLNRGILRALRDTSGRPAFDALWVHGYASVNALHGIVASNLLDIPVLLRAESWSGDRTRKRPKQLLKRAFFHLLRPMIKATLPIGSHNEAYWRESFGSQMPQFPVPYAVNNDFFRERAQEAANGLEDLRRAYDLKPDRPIILFASKLQPRKHADHLLKALKIVLSQIEQPRPYLLIVGEGEQRRPLEQLTAELGLENDVRFTGFQNQSALPAFFQLADVFVLPSRHEPWGLIVNEAMAAGCAVIVSSDVGAGPDLVRDGVNGFLVPVGNIPALATAIGRVLETPEISRRMGKAAQDIVAHWDFEADVRGLRRALAFATGKVRP